MAMTTEETARVDALEAVIMWLADASGHFQFSSAWPNHIEEIAALSEARAIAANSDLTTATAVIRRVLQADL
jgi:hypothetical protein